MIVEIIIMSGVEDGKQHTFDSEDDGHMDNNRWALKIGRHDTNDIVLINDTFVSRNHATLYFYNDNWWLQDGQSTNGTYVENADELFRDKRVQNAIQLELDNMFRIGRTWLKINPQE